MKSKITVLGLLTLLMILLSHTAAASHQNHNLSFFNQSNIDLVDIRHEAPENSERVERYEPENYDFITLSTDIGNSSYTWIDVFFKPQQSYVNYTSSYTSENSYRTNKQADSYTECYESSPSKKKEQENNKENETAEKAKTEGNNSEECEEQEVVVRSDYSKNLEEDMIEIEEGLNRTAMKKSQQKDLKYGNEDFVAFDKDIYIENGTSEDKVRFTVGTSVNGQTFTQRFATDPSYFHKEKWIEEARKWAREKKNLHNTVAEKTDDSQSKSSLKEIIGTLTSLRESMEEINSRLNHLSQKQENLEERISSLESYQDGEDSEVFEDDDSFFGDDW